MLQEEERAVNRSQAQEKTEVEDLRLFSIEKDKVKKGLLCCSRGEDNNCEGCPFGNFPDCIAVLAEKALDVIQELETVRKNLTDYSAGLHNLVKEKNDEIAEIGKRLAEAKQ